MPMSVALDMSLAGDHAAVAALLAAADRAGAAWTLLSGIPYQRGVKKCDRYSDF
jgi:hypothetical protein